ncbi:MAG: ABC transporter ATP-binding protein [Candidatus Eisenbacteria bacterium]|uniref:ABC transporter ATP-binding protein n=1 Tax=Eiseniibacteriota bacterium TaxID=2212470 RepID=A0A538TK15_UNCEI|nr:MAG: ABC transporter ATP-binding protein [Candidatus Eisenbacteria bacterium]TMQ63961.1 MAG: ABC transporter ATP-binding protein [Candidatus Eisenbacteria bacterium]
MNPAAIIARELTKRYGELEAVRSVSFEVGSGEVVGFLGPNGAGKTTTVRMLCCFLPPTSGTASIHGLDVRERPRDVKWLLGVCPQEDNLDPDFDVLKNLLVYGRYFGLPGRIVRRRALELLEFVALSDKTHVPVQALSGGMKRRLILARALLNEPRVLILDEPTTGLDPQARHAIWTRIRSLRAHGTTVLLTTHYMEEATQLCDRVVVMDDGKILLEGAPLDLVEREVGRTVVEAWNYGEEFVHFMRALPGRLEEVGDRLYFYPKEGDHIERLFEERFPHQERLIRRATLEDVFLKLTGRALRD